MQQTSAQANDCFRARTESEWYGGGVQTFMWMTEDNIVEVSFDKGIEVVESDLGKRILQLMQLKPSHIVLLAIHIKREQVGEFFEKEKA